MDSFALSQLVGAGVIGMRVVGNYCQSRFPDAKSIRLISIPITGLTALSYSFMGKDIPALANGIACARSGARSTEVGAKHRKLVSIFSFASMAGLTAIFGESAMDALPVAAIGIGAIMDYQNQGRYHRFMVFGAHSALWFPVACVTGNVAMAASDVVTCTIQGKAIYEHDIKNAAGKNKSLLQNVKAYLHGIFHRSATGASKKGQVSTDVGHQPIDKQYKKLCKERPNPYFKLEEPQPT